MGAGLDYDFSHLSFDHRLFMLGLVVKRRCLFLCDLESALYLFSYFSHTWRSISESIDFSHTDCIARYISPVA